MPILPAFRGAAILLLLAAACHRQGKTMDAGSDRERFAVCRGRVFTPPPAQGFDHTLSSITVATGAANHSAEDLVVPSAAGTKLEAKLTYGMASKDLEDERVRVFLDDCSGWRTLGDGVTDSDGRVSVANPGWLGVGVYEARFTVLGDGTGTRSYLYVLPRGTRLVLTDIDGTLTASDSELFGQMLDGSYVPAAYPGAVALTVAHAQKGSVVLYLTGRPPWLAQRTRDWLAGLGFATGPLHLTRTNEEALPTESGVGSYKLAFLQQLLGAGYIIDVAYGNAATDIGAYLGAGVSPDKVWIIGDQAGQQGTQAVADRWEARAAEVSGLDDVAQPFDW